MVATLNQILHAHYPHCIIWKHIKAGGFGYALIFPVGKHQSSAPMSPYASHNAQGG